MAGGGRFREGQCPGRKVFVGLKQGLVGSSTKPIKENSESHSKTKKKKKMAKQSRRLNRH